MSPALPLKTSLSSFQSEAHYLYSKKYILHSRTKSILHLSRVPQVYHAHPVNHWRRNAVISTADQLHITACDRNDVSAEMSMLVA
jgi:hypothetical protein